MMELFKGRSLNQKTLKLKEVTLNVLSHRRKKTAAITFAGLETSIYWLLE